MELDSTNLQRSFPICYSVILWLNICICLALIFFLQCKERERTCLVCYHLSSEYCIFFFFLEVFQYLGLNLLCFVSLPLLQIHSYRVSRMVWRNFLGKSWKFLSLHKFVGIAVLLPLFDCCKHWSSVVRLQANQDFTELILLEKLTWCISQLAYKFPGLNTGTV